MPALTASTSVPLPTIPTPLPEIELAPDAKRGAPLAVFIRPGEDGESPSHERLDADWLSAVGVTGKAGAITAGPLGSAVRWVAGIGDGTPDQFRSAGAELIRTVNARAAADADAGRRVSRALQVELGEDIEPEQAGALVLGLLLGGYKYAVTREQAKPRAHTIRLITSADLAETVAKFTALAQATAFARDLANTPSNIKDPAWLAGTAARVAGTIKGLRAEVRDEKWLADKGFGGVLAVGGGSSRPPRLLELSWGPRTRSPHLVLVGKGITFDTGGISIKPADGMHLMRTDMAGGAAVAAAVLAIAKLGLPVRVTGLVPCAENHVSGTAYRPGDIVRHYGGRTTEVTNTDAEGRMVLADAIAYAARTLKADMIIDVATLTGAMKISLGLRTGGLFATDGDLAERVLGAAEAVGERFWRMPLLEDVAEGVESQVADVRQCPPGPGGIAAALFLREFTEKLPWVHLDIAGPARADSAYDEVVGVGTGFAARTLVETAASLA